MTDRWVYNYNNNNNNNNNHIPRNRRRERNKRIKTTGKRRGGQRPNIEMSEKRSLTISIILRACILFGV